jgi:hypothetical protein
MTDATAPLPRTDARAGRVALLLLVGAAVAIGLGAYAHTHSPAGRPLFTLGFSGMLQMKVWLTTGAAVLILVQLTTALWMWGRLPGTDHCPAWVAPVHRWSGATAFVLTLAPAFHCLWALGFGTGSTRVIAHGIAGCVFYGAYAAKMIGLRIDGLPARTIPLIGGLALATFAVIWLSSALWFFTRSGLPLT